MATKKVRKPARSSKRVSAVPAPKPQAETTAETEVVEQSEIEESSAPPEIRNEEIPTISEVEPERKIVTLWHIYLDEGSTYEVQGFKFVAGRPLTTTDPAIYERFKYNGRLRIESSKGGG